MAHGDPAVQCKMLAISKVKIQIFCVDNFNHKNCVHTTTNHFYDFVSYIVKIFLYLVQRKKYKHFWQN